jgi:hypothetical protein
MRTWLYHPNRPEGQLFENYNNETSARLAAEGWVASPADLPAKASTPSLLGDATPAPRAAPAEPVSSSGRVMTATTALVSTFTPADRRAAKLFDKDGDPMHADLSDEDVLTILTDMSREELIELLAHMNGADTSKDSDQLRYKALGELRPHMMPEHIEDVVTADGVDPEIVETQKPDAPSSEPDASDMTAAEMRAELDARGVPYKTRDGKEALAKLLADNPRKE